MRIIQEQVITKLIKENDKNELINLIDLYEKNLFNRNSKEVIILSNELFNILKPYTLNEDICFVCRNIKISEFVMAYAFLSNIKETILKRSN